MCGRFTLTRKDLGQLPRDLNLVFDPSFDLDFSPAYNIAPTASHWIICRENNRNCVVPATWGFLPEWAKEEGQLLINARAETAKDKPTFRRAFRERRCLVLADGFYEWMGKKGKKQPVHFHTPNSSVLLFAGLFSPPSVQSEERRFTILTTSADDAVKPIHHRMPVILSAQEAERWLMPAEGADLISLHRLIERPAPTALSFAHVSRRVNDARENSPDLIAALDETIPPDPSSSPSIL